MQNAKDTFYEVLRDRVAAGNAARTVVVRGVVRAAVVVEENELVASAELRDCFRVRWTTLKIDGEGPAVLAAMGCEVRYATRGSAGAGGLDRGRALAAMDADLQAALGASPQWAVKKNFAGPDAGGTTMGSRVWWSDVAFGAISAKGSELSRVATVMVWGHLETGELEEAGAQ